MLFLSLLTVGCNGQPGVLPRIGGNRADAGAVAERLHTLTSAVTSSDSHSANFIHDRQSTQKAYEAIQYAPAWVREGQVTPQALAVISALEDSQQKGLNPEDYQASRWHARVTALKTGSASADTVAQFDAALTTCALRYLSNLRIGRANPKPSEFGMDLENQHYDLPQFLVQKVLTGSNIPDILSKVEPQYLGYQRTEIALRNYLTLAAQDHGDPLPDPQQIVKNGSAYVGAAQLGERLRLLGDWPPGAQADLNATTYDGPLVEAVSIFNSGTG